MIPLDFYLREDPLQIGKELLGNYLFTNEGGILTGGQITEVESYYGKEDKACHAYKGRRTKRTEVMFHRGGICYIYLCYGMHFLLNIVTNIEEIPHAILIRKLRPSEGIPLMLKRRNKKSLDQTLLSGPGCVSQALGIDLSFNGISLLSPKIWIEAGPKPNEIFSGPRIGIDYAGEDALKPWRYWI